MPTIIVPASVNYQAPLIAVPSRVLDAPAEGPMMIACEIDWGEYSQSCVAFNFSNNATLDFSQIIAISVDNSLCGSDITFIFPDTGETTSIPAYAPKLVIEVFTNQKQFFVAASGLLSDDVTRFSILNFLPPPIAIPSTVEQLTSTAANIPVDGSTGVYLIPADVSGTLEGITLSRAGPVNTVGGNQWNIINGDGTPTFLVGDTDFRDVGATANNILLSLTSIHIRFHNGLRLTQSGVNSGGFYSANCLYRIP